jgi:hypothetical protein
MKKHWSWPHFVCVGASPLPTPHTPLSSTHIILIRRDQLWPLHDMMNPILIPYICTTGRSACMCTGAHCMLYVSSIWGGKGSFVAVCWSWHLLASASLDVT